LGRNASRIDARLMQFRRGSKLSALRRTTPQLKPAPKWNSAGSRELCPGELGNELQQDGTAPLAPLHTRERDMHQIIYLVGLIVVILAILSFFGLR